MSKAFTIMGVFLLRNKGYINFNDKVSKYINNFYLVYDKCRYDCTIEDLIYHRTGIPFEQVNKVVPGEDDDSLKINCEKLIGLKTRFIPGTEYLYSSCNTNLLAYIIEIVTENTYEDYIRKNILIPLELNNTYLFKENARQTNNLAQGYRYMFFKPRKYEREIIRGNTPAAYIISSAKDMERWLKINIGMVAVITEFSNIIDEMHVAKNKIDDENYIGAGWNINDNGLIWFRGNNPNYQSAILFDKRFQNGACILTNICTSTVYYIIENIFKVQKKSLVQKYKPSPFKRLDEIFSIVDIFGCTLSCILLFRLIYKWNSLCFDPVFFSSWILVFSIVNIFLYKMPNLLTDYKTINWRVVKDWASKSIYYFRDIIEILLILILLNNIMT